MRHRHPFSIKLLRLANEAEPGALQAMSIKALELWALLPAAQAEADERRNDSLGAHLNLINAALTVPEHDHG